MKLKDLLEGVPGVLFNGNEEEEIQGIAYSSKDVQPGFLFAALKGEKKDGVEFIEEAVLNGAVVFLSEKPKPTNFEKTWLQASDAREALALCSANFYSHPSQKMKVVGVTGTKGKTTITYLLEEILKESHFLPAVIGTISYRSPSIKISAERTTPEAPYLQRMLAEMLAQGVTHCLIEVSSHALELKRVLGIGFDIALFSNLSGEHLDYHHTMQKYFEAKKKLFFLNHKKITAVINSDDPWGKKLISELPSGVVTYGLEPGAHVMGKNFKLLERGIELSVKHPAGELLVFSPLLGKPNLYNILASIAVALKLNIAVSAIKEGIASLQQIPGRFENIKNSLGLHIFVDYAHTDDALKNLLETVHGLNPRRIILVFGAGGDRDKAKRPRMGEVAGNLSDWTILTSDNPRSEDPMAIISDIEKGIKKTGTKNYEILPDRKEAIERALSLGEKGDYILVAGKGHEDYQIIKDKVIPFKDADVIRSILEIKESA
ncbi:MAG: UDP-N-acetylmuramoyl-L-alanyl-D-glutamate--2,6-diaminopimelate ligase [Candidatus Aminicenantes bacterium]|nr:UDP-N-acetylmuramoyl-L-alanyl-D-glutamate--2,6-diaminopimelate ligase [Candidatus Aminicenantes bacterium]